MGSTISNALDKNSNEQVMVDFTKVSKIYPPDVRALVDVSFQIKKGSIAFLTGMSGAGKTTLMHLMCGIEQLSKGYIEINGQDLSRISRSELQKLRRNIGMAYQDFKLLPDLSVARNIAVSMEVSYRSRLFIRKQVKNLLAQLNLENKINTRVGKLSRGEQQRVALARAVANKPSLILADEPTGNLDGETKELVMKLFHRCNREGATILIASHDRSIYNRPENEIFTLANGRLIEHILPEDEHRNDEPDELAEFAQKIDQFSKKTRELL